MQYEKSKKKEYKFQNHEELIDHIANLCDIEPINKHSIRGTGSQLKALKQNGEGRGSLYRNPLIPFITSSHGELFIGSHYYNFDKPKFKIGNSRKQGLFSPGVIGVATHATTCSDHQSGLEICRSDDGGSITYSDGESSISFSSYKESNWYGYWEMVTEIKTTGLNFQAAIINSRYIGRAVNQVCAVMKTDHDEDFNDNYVDEYEWGIFAEQPTRVESLSRAQWNNKRISGITSAGSECFTIGVEPFPDGYPDNWPALDGPETTGTVIIQPNLVNFTTKVLNRPVTKSINLRNTYDRVIQVTVENAITNPTNSNPADLGGLLTGSFSNISGSFSIPSGGNINVGVTFNGERGLGTITGRLGIAWEGIQRNISLSGIIIQVSQISQ
jgi:hypothetical protein